MARGPFDDRGPISFADAWVYEAAQIFSAGSIWTSKIEAEIKGACHCRMCLDPQSVRLGTPSSSDECAEIRNGAS